MSDFDLIYDGIEEKYGIKPSRVIEYLNWKVDEADDISLSAIYGYEANLFDILLDIVTGSINPMKKLAEMLDKYSQLVKDNTTRE